MKYIIRILVLPFAIILWVVSSSIKWIQYGGELRINLSKEVVNPVELRDLLKDLNQNILTLIEETK
jgi:hypothetical protein